MCRPENQFKFEYYILKINRWMSRWWEGSGCSVKECVDIDTFPVNSACFLRNSQQRVISTTSALPPCGCYFRTMFLYKKNNNNKIGAADTCFKTVSFTLQWARWIHNVLKSDHFPFKKIVYLPLNLQLPCQSRFRFKFRYWRHVELVQKWYDQTFFLLIFNNILMILSENIKYFVFKILK